MIKSLRILESALFSSNRLLRKYIKMSASLEKRYFIANWKMNLTFTEVKAYMNEFLPLLNRTPIPTKEILLAPSFPYLSYLKETFVSHSISLCAQDVSSHQKGPFTGDVSGMQLKSIGVSHVIIGHSERRQHYKEDTHTLLQKCLRAWENNIIPIFCAGETLEIQENGKTLEFIDSQVSPLLNLFIEQKSLLSSCPFVIAYEPIWAIGTGKVASLPEIEEVHAFLKSLLQRLLPDYKIPILYGGSVTPQNAKELLSSPLINGFLIGGSSLSPSSFWDIIQA